MPSRPPGITFHLGARRAGKWRVQGQELWFRVRVTALRDQDLAHGGAVVEAVDGEEASDLLPILVHILQQDAVAPHAQPGVDALRADRSLARVEAAQRLLDALQAVLALPGHGRAQVQHPAPADGRGVAHSHRFAEIAWNSASSSAAHKTGCGSGHTLVTRPRTHSLVAAELQHSSHSRRF